MKKQFLLLTLLAIGIAGYTGAQSHYAVARSVAVNDNCGGFYEFLPAGYSDEDNAAKMYPLLIDVQGTGSEGNGSPEALQKLLQYGVAYYISEGAFPGHFSVAETNHTFIVISAQFKKRGGGTDIKDLITFLLDRYRIDRSRIYLVGYSAGGEPVWNYPCLGPVHSNTIAAMVPIAGVNTNRYYRGVDHIATAALPVWALHSKDDEVGMTPVENSINFVNKINEHNPAVPATFTMLTGTHKDTWSKVYDPSVRYTINGKNVNIYEWMLQYARVSAVLPVTLLSYSTSLTSEEDVLIQWETGAEKNNDFFVLERTLNGEIFEEIAQVPAMANNEKGCTYTWLDKRPVHGKSWYRLSQVDKDGKQHYFDIKEVNIEQSLESVKVFPTLIQDNIIKIALTPGDQGLAEFRIINMNGAIIHHSSVSTTGGNIIQLSPQKWSRGTYVVEVKWNGKVEKGKVMKL